MRKRIWNLTGKSVLITGAACGIGAATAKLLAKQNTFLSLVDIQGSALLVRGIEHRSRTVATPTAHLALLVPDAFQLAIERLARTHGWAAIIHQQEYVKEGEKQLHG